MGCPSEFDINRFKLIFNQFSETSDELIKFYSDNVINTFGCKIKNKTNCEYLLFLMVAHFLALKESGTVGEITSASMGSVSASFDTSRIGRDGFWLQTSYGMELYNMLFRRDTFKVF